METAASGQKDKKHSNVTQLQIPNQLVQKKNSQAIAGMKQDSMNGVDRSLRLSNTKKLRDITGNATQSIAEINDLVSKPYENQKPSTAKNEHNKSPQKKRQISKHLAAGDVTTTSGARQIESCRAENVVMSATNDKDKQRTSRRYHDLLKLNKPQFSFAEQRGLQVDVAQAADAAGGREEKILSSSRISNSSNFSALSGNSNGSLGSEACKNKKQFQSSQNLHPPNRRITPHQHESGVGPYGFGRTQLAASTNFRGADAGDAETFDGSSPLVPRDLDSATDEGAPGGRPVMTQEDKTPIVRSQTIRKVESGIPEAMPLIMRISNHNAKEPDLYQKLRRGTTFMHGGGPGGVGLAEPEAFCAHDGQVEQWKCADCKAAISKFNFCFDNAEGSVNQNTKIVFENSFLSDFKHEFRAQAATASFAAGGAGGERRSQVLLYQSYQPQNILELREYIFMLMCKRVQKVNKAAGDDGKKMSPFGSGTYQNLSMRLTRYLAQHEDRQKRLRQQHGRDILLFDSLFESGNLLQAEKNATAENTYNLFMQVDTNTRGHQQWFHYRAKGGKKGTEYTFYIMNFTKPGVSGGRGYKLGEHDMRIVVRSKRKQIQLNDFEKWEDLTNHAAQCAYVKTNVARRKKDVIAAGADSDQEEWIEEAFNQQRNAAATANAADKQLPVINIDGPPNQAQARPGAEQTNLPATKEQKPKRRRVFYYYALRFKYTFEHDDDTVYFAFSRPITYSDILEDLHRKERLLCPKGHGGVAVAPAPALLAPPKKHPLSKQLSMKPRADKSDQASDKGASLVNKRDRDANEKGDRMSHANAEQLNQQYDKFSKQHFKSDMLIENSNLNIYYKRTQFCSTITGLPLYKIVISRDQRSAKNNSIVLITSRVHSGETPGSEVFRGIYNFITSDSREAKYLRRFYTFILIPCMNPDGVVCGNYRNSTAGVDLNRQWINPEPEYHPEVCGVKQLMQEIKEEDKRQIWIFCDLHGHSKKKNSFFYGCNTAANGGFLSWTIVRLLPRIFAQKTHMFNYKDCRFRVEPYKIGTARIVAWKQFAITHSFTLENSFYGYDIGEDESRIFTQEDYHNVGLKFMLSIYDMHSLWKQIRRELQITHGWLKPRTLNEMTGTPAAQILAQEAAQQKEDERKRKAIEQYEEFLKTFYKSRGGFKRPVTTIEKKMTNKDRKEEGAGPVRRRKPKPAADSEVNKDLELLDVDDEEENQSKDDVNQQLARVDEDTAEAEEESDEEYFLKMHNGLIKIQAVIRGFIDRQRVKKLVQSKQNRMLNKMISHSNSRSNIAGEQSGIKRQRSNQVLANSSAKRLKLGRHNAPSQANLPGGGNKAKGGTGVNRQGYDTSSDGGAKVTAGGTTQLNHAFGDSSNDEHLMRSNTEQLQPQNNLSDSGMTNKSIETHGAGGLFGSMSMFGWSRKTNPLGGGGSNNQKQQLAWRDFFEGEELDRAYQIVEVEQRDETDGEGSANITMGSDSDPSGDNLDEEEVYRDVYGVSNPGRLIEQKKQREQEFIEKVQTDAGATQADMLNQLLNREGTPDLRALNDQSLDAELLGGDDDAKDGDQDNKEADDEAAAQANDKPVTPALADAVPLPSASRQDNSHHGSPTNGGNTADSGNKKNENLFHSMSQNARRLLKSSNQQRALTQQANAGQLANTQNLTQQIANGGVGAARLVQQSFYMMRQKCQLNGKKQNINQVIKDCFIIKKVGSRGLQGQKEGGKTRGQSRAKETAQHRGARRVVGKILQGANAPGQATTDKVASHSPEKRDMLMNMMLLQQQQNPNGAANSHSQPAAGSTAEAFQQLSLMQKQQIYYQNVMLHQQRQALLDQQAQAQAAARLQSSTGNLPAQASTTPLNLNSQNAENRKKMHTAGGNGLPQQANMLLGSGYETQGRLSQPQNRILNEAQAQQLIDQLNAAMKNMTQSQAIQFLKMIQDKNVYFQLANDPRVQKPPKPRSNAQPVPAQEIYGASQTTSNYHKYQQLQMAEELQVDEHAKMLKTFNNVATSHLHRPESHSANKALSSAKNTLDHPRVPGHEQHQLMSQSALHVGYNRHGLRPTHETKSNDEKLRAPAIGVAQHHMHYYSGKDQYGAPLLPTEHQRKFGATVGSKMVPLVLEQAPASHQALSQQRLAVPAAAGTLRELRGAMPQVHHVQGIGGKPPSASRGMRPSGAGLKNEVLSVWAGGGSHQVDNFVAHQAQDSRRLQMPHLASVSQYSQHQHQTTTPSQQSTQIPSYSGSGLPQHGTAVDLTRTFYAQKASTHATGGAQPSQPDTHSMLLLASSVHGSHHLDGAPRGPIHGHHKQSVGSGTQPPSNKNLVGQANCPPNLVGHEYENQGTGSSLFMKYVKKKATLQNVNLSASGAAMLADSSEQLAPLSGHQTVGPAQSSGHTALAAGIKISKAHHVSAAQNLARMGATPQQSQGYSKAQLLVDRERRERLRDVRNADRD